MLNLFVSAVIAVTGFFSEPKVVTAEPEPSPTKVVEATYVTHIEAEEMNAPDVPDWHSTTTIRELVEVEFGVGHEMNRIIWCESKFYHYDKNGEVLRGKVNPRDIGFGQVNLDAHEKRAEELGIDLFDPMDHMAYIIILYNEQGNSPWKYSAGCWM